MFSSEYTFKYANICEIMLFYNLFTLLQSLITALVYVNTGA